MTNTTISIPVVVLLMLAYSQASVEQQQKIQLLLRLRVRELFASSDVSLQQIMDDIGAKAEARGLTPQILETLLGDES
jgi:ABC-type proline/glycine betaine transport system permease subunit